MVSREADRVILTMCQERGAQPQTFSSISQQLGNKTPAEVSGFSPARVSSPRETEEGTGWPIERQAPRAQRRGLTHRAHGSGSRRERALDFEVESQRFRSSLFLGPNLKPLEFPYLWRARPSTPCCVEQTRLFPSACRASCVWELHLLALGFPPFPRARAALPHGL